MKEISILAIGNSFSEDATAYLKKIADSAGVPVKVVNLYIGGCSMDTHAVNCREDNACYGYQEDGVITDRSVSVDWALRQRPWDIVTIQQVSHSSGIYSTYREGQFLLEYVRRRCPEAKIWFHKTWSYEYCSTHSQFYLYNCVPQEMDRAIGEAAGQFCAENGLPCIPVGDVIAALKRLAEFDSEHGGQSLYRDGFHMHLIYGRYAAAAVWFQTLLGDLTKADFYPRYPDIINGYEAQLPSDFVTEERLIAIIRDTVISICHKNNDR